MKKSFWKPYSFNFGYNRFPNGFGDTVLFIDVQGISFEVDIIVVQPSFRLDTIYSVVRTNYTNFNIIPKLEPVYYIFNDREVFVFLWTSDKISKDIAYNFINYKDYLLDYPSVVLIVVPIFFRSNQSI